jgi:hypothetical protein
MSHSIQETLSERTSRRAIATLSIGHFCIDLGFCLSIRLCPEAHVRVELVAARVRRIQHEGIDFPFVEIVSMMALQEKQTLLLPFLAFLAMEFLPFFKACFIPVLNAIMLLIAADVGHVPVRLGRVSSAVMG